MSESELPNDLNASCLFLDPSMIPHVHDIFIEKTSDDDIGISDDDSKPIPLQRLVQLAQTNSKLLIFNKER